MEKMLSAEKEKYWNSLESVELFIENNVVRAEYLTENGERKFRVLVRWENEKEREMIRKLAIAYIRLPIVVKRTIPMNIVGLDESLFMKSKFYVGEGRNYWCCALEQFLIELTNFYYNGTGDLSFISAFIDNYIEENERENLLNMFLKLKRKVHQYCSKDERDWLDNMCETIFGF